MQTVEWNNNGTYVVYMDSSSCDSVAPIMAVDVWSFDPPRQSINPEHVFHDTGAGSEYAYEC